jgi:hypothetical protein
MSQQSGQTLEVLEIIISVILGKVYLLLLRAESHRYSMLVPEHFGDVYGHVRSYERLVPSP